MVDAALLAGSPQKGSIDAPLKKPTETDPQTPEVTRTENGKKNENEILEAWRGFSKIIIYQKLCENN